MPSSQDSLEEFCMEGALLHGNLSAILAVQQLWSSCLEEILTALELHLVNITSIKNCGNKSLILRLKTRLDKCCKQLNLPPLIEWDHNLTLSKLLEIHHSLIVTFIDKNKKDVKTIDIPKPKYNHNSTYYGLSNGVRVDTNCVKGRHVVATQPFEPGDIIAVEPAGGWITTINTQSHGTNDDDNNNFKYLLLLPSQRMNQCSKCFNQLNSVGFVCPYCCDAAYCELSRDCSSQCKKIKNSLHLFQDFQQPALHMVECRFMFLLNSIGLGHLCFRLAWLRQHYPHSHQDSYLTTDQLVEHFMEFPVEDLFEYALTGWLISKILNYNHKTNLKLVEKENEMIQGLWCFDTLRRLQCNAHAVTEIQAYYPDLEAWLPNQLNVSIDLKVVYPFIRRLRQARIATGLFPCVSLLNHSCDPNIIHNFQNSLIILRCLKPITPGSEIFNCYGPHYLHYPSASQRLTLLQQQYFFICSCEYCTKSASCSLSLNQSSITPTEEMSTKWKNAVDQLLLLPWSPIQSLDKLKNAIHSVQQAGNLQLSDSWWPLDENLGSLLDTIGRYYLIHSKLLQKKCLNDDDDDKQQSKWLFRQNAGFWCLKSSVQWVQSHFGTVSCEYLWELINLLNLSINYFDEFNVIQLNLPKEFTILDQFLGKEIDFSVLNNNDSILSEINRLSTILYGVDKGQLIIEQFVQKQ
ncbi:unnamed protein product [Heterobilharzia americana]|nr:unnamed protein product [Heterobilharzia americana]